MRKTSARSFWSHFAAGELFPFPFPAVSWAYERVERRRRRPVFTRRQDEPTAAEDGAAGQCEAHGGAAGGAFAMIAGLVIVPVVSLFTPKPEKGLVDFAFAGYDQKVVVSARDSLGNSEPANK